jgi:4-azaleucine resistance transporter AzlC
MNPPASGGQRHAALDAARDTLPLIVGMTPFALAFGAVAAARGLPGLSVVTMSATVYAGLAQFMVVNLYSRGVDDLPLLLGFVFLVNLRFSLMGLSLGPHTRGQPGWLRGLLAFGLSDEPYAAVIGRFTSRGYDLVYQCTAYLLVYVAWVAGTAAGVAFAQIIRDPLAWGLDFAMVATFLVLLVPRLKSWSSLAAALLSGAAAAVLQSTRAGEGAILIASLFGFAVAALIRRREARERPATPGA